MNNVPVTYRKKPVEVEVMRLDGPPKSSMAVVFWMEDNAYPMLVGDYTNPQTLRTPRGVPDYGNGVYIDPANGDLIIRTLEGDMRASYGDYVIKGVAGEFYPCKPDIFEATYEKV